MAGRVRHPIDIKALEKYINENVPEIKTPLDVKQVSRTARREGQPDKTPPLSLVCVRNGRSDTTLHSSASVNRIPHTSSRRPTANAM